MFHQDLLSPLGMVLESEGRPRQAICYRAADETGKLDMEERRENNDLKTAHLLYWHICFFGRLGWWVTSNTYCIWQLR